MEHMPFVFIKTYEQRLAEFQEILKDKYMLLGVSSEIYQLWVNYIELYVKDSDWKALWKISRKLCNELNLCFPMNVVVLVESINYKTLSANINVLNEDNSIDIPEKFDGVPLIQLFPLVEQENGNFYHTAEAIDNLRLFYCHLFYPWEKEDSESHWVIDNLENRLNLYDALTHNRVLHETTSEITCLINKGKQLYEKILKIEKKVNEEVLDRNCLELFELRSELGCVKNKLSVYHNPELRCLKMQKNRENLMALRENRQHFSFVVMVNEHAKELYKFLDEVKAVVHPDTLLMPLPSLQEALDKLIPDETIFIGPGTYRVSTCGGLIESGTGISGIAGEDPCIITESEENWLLFDLRGSDVMFKDLTFESGKVCNILIVRHGVCSLKNVIINGGDYGVGVMVHPGATLHADNCTFISCRDAIVAKRGSDVYLSNCTFKKNNIAIEAEENSNMALENCTISDSSEFAVKLYKTGDGEACHKGSEELLLASDITEVSGLKLENNSEDVLIEQIDDTHVEMIKKAAYFSMMS